MKPKDIEYFENELMRLRSQLLSRADHRVEPHEKIGADGVPDFADYAAEKAESVVHDRIAGSESNLKLKVELAFERLEAGTYNQCADCGKKIPLERLRAKPTVSLCVSCQQAKEDG